MTQKHLEQLIWATNALDNRLFSSSGWALDDAGHAQVKRELMKYAKALSRGYVLREIDRDIVAAIARGVLHHQNVQNDYMWCAGRLKSAALHAYSM